MMPGNDHPDGVPARISLLKRFGIASFSLLMILGGFFLPGAFWGSHAPHYLPLWLQFIFLFSGIGGLVIFLSGKTLFRTGAFLNFPSQILMSVLPTIAFCLCMLMPIRTVIYGDHLAYRNSNLMKEKRNVAPVEFLKQALLANPFSSHAGDDVINPKKAGPESMNRFAVFLHLKFPAFTYEQIYGFINAVFCALFIIVLIRFLDACIRQPLLKYAGLITGSLSGFLLVFFPYCEAYAIPAFGLLLFFSQCVFVLRQPSAGNYALLLLAFFLTLKFHSAGFVLLPSLMFTLLHPFRDRLPDFLFIGKGFVFAALFFFSFFLVVYFIKGDAFTGPEYDFHDALVSFEHNFLPVQPSSLSPARFYTLQSPYHCFDFLNEIFLVFAPGIFLLMALIFWRKSIRRNENAWRIPALSAFGLVVFFFFGNPLLSMPRDWDALSLFVPGLLVTLLLLADRLSSVQLSSLLAPLAGLGIYSLAFILLSTGSGNLPERLSDTGLHVYRTYWSGGAHIHNTAAGECGDATTEIALRERYLPLFRTDAIRTDGYYFHELGKALFRKMILSGKSDEIPAAMERLHEHGIPQTEIQQMVEDAQKGTPLTY